MRTTIPVLPRLSILFLLALAAAMLGSCKLNDAEGDQYLRLELGESLAGYDSVHIDLVSLEDTGDVYEVVWHDKLENPAAFPRHKLTEAKGKTFLIRIRAYDSAGNLVMAKDVEVRDAKPQPTVVVKADLRLLSLVPSRGALSPAFDPEVGAYSLDLQDSGTTLAFTVTAMDQENNTLALKGDAVAWGAIAPRTLVPGTNAFDFAVQGKQGGASRSYVVSVKLGVNREGAPVVRILSPEDGYLTNRDTVEVSWTADDVEQTERTREIIGAPDGVKIISREKSGTGGKVGQDEVRITRDTEPPKAPKAGSVTPTSVLRPEWSWAAVEGGNGAFRLRLDTASLDGRAETRELSFKPAGDLAPGVHKLYLQARDAAGNWSATDSFAVTILGKDATPPEPPKLRGTSPTNSQPKWIWSQGGGDGAGDFEYKLGDGDFSDGAVKTRDTAYALAGNLVSKTTYTLYVRERDAAGNWSEPASLGILYDDTKPSVAILLPRESGTHYFTEGTVNLSGTVKGPNAIAKVAYRLGSGSAVAVGFADGKWSIAGLAVAEGAPVAITVSAEDALGNSSDAQLTLHRDNTKPVQPTLVNQPPAATREAKGTWTWIAGTDAPPGSGLSGKYRYNLNGGAWTEISTLVVADLALADGANIFSVQNQDRAGNWSESAQSAVKLDSTKPFLSITSPATNPASQNTLKITLSGSVSDAGSGVSSVSVSGFVSGTAAATVTGGTWRSAELTLKSGANALQVTAVDGQGNTATVPLTVNVSVGVAKVTITHPPLGYATNKDTVTLRYRVNDGPEITAPAPSNLPVGITVLTAYSEPNEAGVRGSADISVTRDVTPPNAPSLSAVLALTNGDPLWNWTSNGDAANGAGLPTTPIFRYQLNGAAPVELSVRNHRVIGGAEGNYTLAVAERDKAGNWSAYSAAVSVVVDRTGPVVTITSHSNGFITNKESVTIVYTEKDGAAAAVTKTQVAGLVSGGAVNTVTITSAQDAAGNTGTATVNLYRRSNVLFVRPTAFGAGDGSSWADALGSINTAIAQAVSGTHVWVAAGAYFAPGTDSGFPVKGNMHIYGGFNPNGTANKIEDRTFGASDTSTVSGGSAFTQNLFSVRGTSTYLGGIVIDGFKLSIADGKGGVDLNQVSGITLRNLLFVASGTGSTATALKTHLGSSLLGENLKFTRFKTEYYVIQVSGSMDFKNIEFSGNTLPSEGGGAFIYGGRDMSFDNCRFLDAIHFEFHHIQQSGTDGKLSILNTTFRIAVLASGMSGAVVAQATGANRIYTNNTFVP